MVCTNEAGSKFLAGIRSWGITCGDPKYPGVFTHIVEYVDWIQTTMRDLSTLPRANKTKKMSPHSSLFLSFVIFLQNL